MAKISLKRLRETNEEKYPSNTLTDYYDIIHKLMEALSLSVGIKFNGEGAHKELIDFVCEENELGESTREFVQRMREYRNRISYEGFKVKENFITLNKEKINSIIQELFSLLK